MVTLEKGTKFIQSYEGCKNPITFEVINLDRDKDTLHVKGKTFDKIHEFEEIWVGLKAIEHLIDLGDYKILN